MAIGDKEIRVARGMKIRVKHEHKWSLYSTYSGGGTNGTVRICDECGARKKFGVSGDRLVSQYARKGESFKDINK
jgi:hypothetical protein